MAKNQNSKKMTEEEIAAWDDLYEYVRSKVMGYDENQSLSTPMVLRLKGLLTGKFMENGSVRDRANYTYETILYTFKFCSQSIRTALQSVSFKDEMHKFNYMLRIVERNINDVYLRLKNAKRSEERVENMKTDVLHHEGAEYVAPKESTVQKSNPNLEGLW